VQTPPAYSTFESAYLDVLDHVSGNFEYRNAPRGNASHECIGLSFQLTHPRERFPYLAARKLNPVFHFAEAIAQQTNGAFDVARRCIFEGLHPRPPAHRPR
jgi:thymidylate synthase